MNKYQNSECKKIGWLHDYQIVEVQQKGVLERCSRCGDRQFFPHDTPNFKYLEYHIRSALQKNDKRYAKEYGAN